MIRTIKNVILLILFVGSSFQLFSSISSRVQGTVIDKETKLPLERVSVELIELSAEGYFQMNNWQALTDKSGKFSFDVEPYICDRYYLMCSKDGYIPKFRKNFRGSVEQSKLAEVLQVFKLKEGRIIVLNIVLEKGAVLKGKLLKKMQSGISLGQNISGILTIRRDENHSYLKKYDIEELNEYLVDGFDTNDKGEFEIKGIENGTYDIFISNDDYKDHYIKNIQIAKGEIKSLEQTLDYSIQNEVKGIVKRNGERLTSGSIYFFIYRPDGSKESCGSQIQPNGFYSCKGLLPGKYKVIISTVGDDRETKKESFEIDILSGVTSRDFSIR